MFTHNSTKKSCRNRKLAGMLSAMADTPHQFQGQQVKVTRPLNAMTGNQPRLWNGKVCRGLGHIVAAIHLVEDRY